MASASDLFAAFDAGAGELLQGTHRLVLLALADANARDALPASAATLGRRAGLAARTVESALVVLRAAGWIAPAERLAGAAVRYRVTIPEGGTSDRGSDPPRPTSDRGSDPPPIVDRILPAPPPIVDRTPSDPRSEVPPGPVPATRARRICLDPDLSLDPKPEGESIREGGVQRGKPLAAPEPLPATPAGSSPEALPAETPPAAPPGPTPAPPPPAGALFQLTPLDPEGDLATKVQTVLEHWAAQPYHGHRPKLTEARRARVRSRLAERFTVDELKQALTNANRDDWLTGRDPRTNGKKWVDVDTLLRDAAQVERLRDLTEDAAASSDRRDAEGEPYEAPPMGGPPREGPPPLRKQFQAFLDRQPPHPDAAIPTVESIRDKARRWFSNDPDQIVANLEEAAEEFEARVKAERQRRREQAN